MLWVEHLRYVGPDRRRRRAGLRINERRHEECAGAPPALRTALRQLRIRVLETHEPVGRAAFCMRASATAFLANEQRCRPVGDVLMNLVRRLSSMPGAADPREMIYSELDRAEALLDGAAPAFGGR